MFLIWDWYWEHGQDGILVESEGYDYPRYACLVPNARALHEEYTMTDAEKELRELIRSTADKAVELARLGEDIYSSDLIDREKLEWLANAAVTELLLRREDVSRAQSLYPWIPSQPDMIVALDSLRKIKFYCPLKIMQIPEEDPMDIDTYSDDPEEIPSHRVVYAIDEIDRAIQKYASPCEKNRGLMAYLDDRELLGKVYSIFPSVEKVGNDVMGVYTCQLYDELDSYELGALHDELVGQSSDGWGEGFEQHEISTNDCGRIYVSFHGAEDWELKTEYETTIPDTEVQSLDDGDISM